MDNEEAEEQPVTASPLPEDASATVLYLDLLEAVISGRLIEDPSIHPQQKGYNPDCRRLGWDWPQYAHSMIGTERLRSLRLSVEQVLREGVPGDLLETGVWRGGACILMRGVLAAYRISDRKVWVCDSFQGLPPPDAALYPVDAGDKNHTYAQLRVSAEEVRQNFSKYGLLDDQVVFVEGWFRDTLPQLPVVQLAILRLDGDMFGSTMDALRALYHKLSPGGFLIVDDYALPGCRAAIDEFRKQHGITEAVHNVDGVGAFWRRAK